MTYMPMIQFGVPMYPIFQIYPCYVQNNPEISLESTEKIAANTLQNIIPPDPNMLFNREGYGFYQNAFIPVTQTLIPVMVCNNSSVQLHEPNLECEKFCNCKENDLEEVKSSSSVSHMATPTSTKKQTKTKKKETFKDDFIEYSKQVLAKIEDIADQHKTILHKSEKPAKSKNSKHPEKRSKYIGVSKNGNNWQALVVIGLNKVYLGTFKTEIEASYVFDFYSIISHFTEAKVNRSYNSAQILNMIMNFKDNNDDFDVEKYLDGLNKQ